MIIDINWLAVFISGIIGLVEGIYLPSFAECLMRYKGKKKKKAYEEFAVPKWAKYCYLFAPILVNISVVICFPLDIAIFISVFAIPGYINSYTDIKYRIIANEVVFPLFIAGLCYQFAVNQVQGLLSSVFAICLVVLVCFGANLLVRMMSKRSGSAAGDVKYLMAVSAAVGFPNIVYVIFCMSICMIGYFVIEFKMCRFSVYRVFPWGGYIAAGFVFSYFVKPLLL